MQVRRDSANVHQFNFQSFVFQVELLTIFSPTDSQRFRGLGEQDLSYFSIKLEIKSDHILSSLQFLFFLDKYRCTRCKDQYRQFIFLGANANTQTPGFTPAQMVQGTWKFFYYSSSAWKASKLFLLIFSQAVFF